MIDLIKPRVSRRRARTASWEERGSEVYPIELETKPKTGGKRSCGVEVIVLGGISAMGRRITPCPEG